MPGFVAERCRWQMQRGEDGAAVKIWRNTAIFWAPQEGLRSNFKSFREDTIEICTLKLNGVFYRIQYSCGFFEAAFFFFAIDRRFIS